MITIKLGELREIIEGLTEIQNKDLPIKPAYWFGKLVGKIRKESVDFENARMKLIDKYALKDTEGKPITEDGQYKFSDPEPFKQDFKELTETEIEIDFKPILLDQLGEIKLSPLVMVYLEKFIKEIDD